MEFYLAFYELIKDDLLKTVRESQSSGKVLGSLNTSFLCLIPKTQEGASFDDYRPIANYNLIYKLISKIIARRIKLEINSLIFEEQFEFLHNKDIHDG